MPKDALRPYFLRLVTQDWLVDTARVSLACQGLWARVLCLMDREPIRGIYERNISEACRELGCNKEELITYLQELSKFKTVRINKDIVRLESGRMLREESERQKNAIYQDRHRRKGIVRPLSTDSKAVEVRSLEERKEEREVKEKEEKKDSLPAPTAHPRGPAPQAGMEIQRPPGWGPDPLTEKQILAQDYEAQVRAKVRARLAISRQAELDEVPF